jgi:DHA1 family inner membrane transport protein
MRIVSEASKAPNLASTLNQGAFNLGNATGAWLGGATLLAGLTYGQLPWIGAGVAVLALAGAFVSTRLSAANRTA